MLWVGMEGSRWTPRSSKPVAGCQAGRGGFDSHPFPLKLRIFHKKQRFYHIIIISRKIIIQVKYLVPDSTYLLIINQVNLDFIINQKGSIQFGINIE